MAKSSFNERWTSRLPGGKIAAENTMKKSFSPALVLYCADLEQTLRFYQAAGLAFKRERHERGPWHYACDFGGFVLELYRSPKRAASPEAPQRASRIVLYVDDAEAVRREIADLSLRSGFILVCSGAIIRCADSPIFEAIDPDGHDVLFIQR